MKRYVKKTWRKTKFVLECVAPINAVPVIVSALFIAMSIKIQDSVGAAIWGAAFGVWAVLLITDTQKTIATVRRWQALKAENSAWMDEWSVLPFGATCTATDKDKDNDLPA